VNWMGLPIYVALEPVDMRMGCDRLGGMVREQMQLEPRARALFVFVGKRGHTMKILTWDGTGDVIINKRLDCGRFDLPVATAHGQRHVVVSDALFGAIFGGNGTRPNQRKRRTRVIH
jgi:transposase